MTQPSDTVTGGEAMIEHVAIGIWTASAVASDQPQDYPLWANMTADQKRLVLVAARAAVAAMQQFASLSGEVERLRGITAGPAGAVTPVASMLCVANGDDHGRHVYHQVENVSIIKEEGQGDGPHS